MRVLHVTPFYPPEPARGGMARAAGALCAALAALGHQVTVFTAEGASRAGEEVREGVRVRRFPGPRWAAERLVPFARGLEDAIAAETFDVAHLHGHRSGIVRQAAAALRRRGAGWVLQSHGTFPHHGQRRLAKAMWDAAGGMEAVTRARALLALSDAEARDLPGQAIVVGSGVSEVAARATATATATATAPRLLFVGSDAPQKRGAMLIPLLRALPQVELDVVGPTSAGFARAFGSDASRVTVHGPLDDAGLAAVMRAASLLVHPAVGEAFGMVPFETALAGIPAVVAGGHGCGEWFGRAGGCVVPPDDGASLLREVGRRIGDPPLGLGEAASVAAFAARELAWPRVAARVAAVYASVAIDWSAHSAARAG